MMASLEASMTFSEFAKDLKSLYHHHTPTTTLEKVINASLFHDQHFIHLPTLNTLSTFCPPPLKLAAFTPKVRVR